VIELFSVKDPDRARLLAGKLDRLNAERQEEERRILRSIDERIAGDPALCESYCIVVDGEGWHRGVIGIAATRIVERYHRPAMVILATVKKPSAPAVPFALFICSKPSSPAALFSLAMAVTPTPADSPCLGERSSTARGTGCLRTHPSNPRRFRSRPRR